MQQADGNLGERIGAPTSLTAEQRSVVEQIVAGPRGRIEGPFGPLLHAPRAAAAVQALGAALRFEGTLDRGLFEMAVLMVARAWNQGFEWTAHLPLARSAGVAEHVIESIHAQSRPDFADARAEAAWDIVDETLRTRTASTRAVTRAVEELGEGGVVELLVTVGYYGTLAAVMNAAGTPAPGTADSSIPAAALRAAPVAGAAPDDGEHRTVAP